MLLPATKDHLKAMMAWFPDPEAGGAVPSSYYMLAPVSSLKL